MLPSTNIDSNTPSYNPNAITNPAPGQMTTIDSNPGAPAGPTPINVDTLGTGSSAPITLPPTTPYTPPVTNVSAPAGTTVGTNGQATVTPPPPANKSAVDAVTGLINKLGTEGDTQNNLETQAGTAQLLAQKTADFNAYNQAKIDQTNTIAAMRSSNPEGQDKFGVDAAVAKYQLESDAHISNLAIQSQISSGNYTDAENTITQKLDAMFTPIKDQISALTSLSTLENNDMSDSEKQQAQTQADQLKTDSANVQQTASDLSKLLVSNSTYSQVAPKFDQINQDYINGKIDAATAQNEMYAAAAQYATTPDPKSALAMQLTASEIAKNYSDATGASMTPADIQNLASTLNDYNGQKYITATDLTGYTTAQKSAIIAAAKKAGYPTLSPTESNALDTITTAQSNLQSILTSIQGTSGVLPSTGGILGLGARPGQVATVTLNNWFQTNPNLGSFPAWQASIVSLLGGLKGVGSGRIPLGGLDILLPQSTDTLQTAQGKIANLNTILTNGANGIIKSNSSTAPAPQTFTIGGQSVSAGQTVKYSDGKTGTVQPDGSIKLN